MSYLDSIFWYLRERLDGLIIVVPAKIVLTSADETDGDSKNQPEVIREQIYGFRLYLVK